MGSITFDGNIAIPPEGVRQPSAKGSPTYRLARAEFNQASDAELNGAINALQHELAACAELDAVSAEVS
ncbi:MAG: hypothetical protein M3Q03_06430 [Chloroflexota bacterium]|nr:hypothetical protein [Chloroflexota bacterium]